MFLFAFCFIYLSSHPEYRLFMILLLKLIFRYSKNEFNKKSDYHVKVSEKGLDFPNAILKFHCKCHSVTLYFQRDMKFHLSCDN